MVGSQTTSLVDVVKSQKILWVFETGRELESLNQREFPFDQLEGEKGISSQFFFFFSSSWLIFFLFLFFSFCPLLKKLDSDFGTVYLGPLTWRSQKCYFKHCEARFIGMVLEC
jgi:hypothetical protein